MNGLRARIDYILKHNTFVNKTFKVLASAFFGFIGIFVPMEKNAILFSSLSRKYNDSPREIYEYLLAHEEYSGYKFYWAIEKGDNTEIPGTYKRVTPDTFSYFVTALRCKYWVTSVNIERGLKFKKRKTVYLNTWHGIPIKTVGNAAAGRKDYDFSHIDYFCVSGDYEIAVYEKSFNVKQTQILKCGLPRNDTLYHVSAAEVEVLKLKMGLPLDKKIVLYAPTWRDSKDGGKSYAIKPPIDLKMWEDKLKSKCVILFRAHPYTNKLLGVEFNDFVIDCTNYPDINELMKVSDILISDYSATIFDYSILERPIICFAYDLDEYSRERGFEMDIRKEIPEWISETENEVVEKILNCNYQEEKTAVRNFKERYIKHGGEATKQCVHALLGK